MEVNQIFASYELLPGSVLLVGAILFTIQIYCDFSGYSDIAIGLAKLFGFRLMKNFDNPYFSYNTTEFWRRWHISLSTWFKDYVFTPLMLKYRHLKKRTVYLATFITFLLIGIWHGDRWTFFVFGLMQSIALCFEIYTRKVRKRIRKRKKHLLSYYYFFSWLLTMLFWTIGMIVFRAESMNQAFGIIYRIVENFDIARFKVFSPIYILIAILFFMEWLSKNLDHGLSTLSNKHFTIRYISYFVLVNLILGILISDIPFVYFQF